MKIRRHRPAKVGDFDQVSCEQDCHCNWRRRATEALYQLASTHFDRAEDPQRPCCRPLQAPTLTTFQRHCWSGQPVPGSRWKWLGLAVPRSGVASGTRLIRGAPAKPSKITPPNLLFQRRTTHTASQMQWQRSLVLFCISSGDCSTWRRSHTGWLANTIVRASESPYAGPHPYKRWVCTAGARRNRLQLSARGESAMERRRRR